MSLKHERPFMRRLLRQPTAYPHAYKIQRNLYGILATASSLDAIERTLVEKWRLPHKTGPVLQYPRAEIVVSDYAQLLEESLIETAVFIRSHDEFWIAKEGIGWSKLLKRKCGTSKFVQGAPEESELTLRAACDKIIHHTGFDYGYEGDVDCFSVFLSGNKQGRLWSASLDVKEFCWIGLTYIK
jgi:hypothetical protein